MSRTASPARYFRMNPSRQRRGQLRAASGPRCRFMNALPPAQRSAGMLHACRPVRYAGAGQMEGQMARKELKAGSVAEAYLALLAERGVEYLFANAGTD